MRLRTKLMTAVVTGVALAGAGALTALAANTGAGNTGAGNTSAAATGPTGGPVPPGFQPMSVTFVSPSEGWVLGTAPCSHAPCTSVVRTTDGGHSWIGIPAPVTTWVTTMRFADPSDGFAYGPQLWVTHNGGVRWYRVRQVPGHIVDLEASAGVVYAASENSADRVRIYRSPAGRDDWHAVKGLPSFYSGAIPVITLHGTAAWILADSRVYASPTGSSWVRESFQCPSDWGLTSLAAYNSEHITVLCTGDAGLGSTSKLVYASANGGARFTRAGAPPRGGDGGLLAEPTPRHLFIATASGATWLYVSNNGGRTWHSALTLTDGGKGWADFGFTTTSQGVAIEGEPAIGSRLFMTWNAGKTWQPIEF
jgi:hypothetical protein